MMIGCMLRIAQRRFRIRYTLIDESPICRKELYIMTSTGNVGHSREVRGGTSRDSNNVSNFRFDNQGQKMFYY